MLLLEYLKKVNDFIREIFFDIKFNIVPQTNLLFKVDEEFIQFVKDEYDSEMGISWDYKIRYDNSKKSLSENRFLENLKLIFTNNINVAISITVQKHLLELDPIEMLDKFAGAKSIDFELLTIFDEKTQGLKVSNIKWAKFLKILLIIT